VRIPGAGHAARLKPPGKRDFGIHGVPLSASRC
jgi:hypothetical protein